MVERGGKCVTTGEGLALETEVARSHWQTLAHAVTTKYVLMCGLLAWPSAHFRLWSRRETQRTRSASGSF